MRARWILAAIIQFCTDQNGVTSTWVLLLPLEIPTTFLEIRLPIIVRRRTFTTQIQSCIHRSARRPTMHCAYS